jgi:hypothetical protein
VQQLKAMLKEMNLPLKGNKVLFLNTQFNTDVCSCFLNCSLFDCTLLDLVIYRRS